MNDSYFMYLKQKKKKNPGNKKFSALSFLALQDPKNDDIIILRGSYWEKYFTKMLANRFYLNLQSFM